ncbi:hypothetical protein H7347_09180, partial [Corynebacterium sp. zg-331]|uniref:hypothetical protein n=1 Tax=unclassified Corynebacterium TaxID=2624378 RepID=UPI00128CD20A
MIGFKNSRKVISFLLSLFVFVTASHQVAVADDAFAKKADSALNEAYADWLSDPSARGLGDYVENWRPNSNPDLTKVVPDLGASVTNPRTGEKKKAQDFDTFPYFPATHEALGQDPNPISATSQSHFFGGWGRLYDGDVVFCIDPFRTTFDVNEQHAVSLFNDSKKGRSLIFGEDGTLEPRVLGSDVEYRDLVNEVAKGHGVYYKRLGAYDKPRKIISRVNSVTNMPKYTISGILDLKPSAKGYENVSQEDLNAAVQAIKFARKAMREGNADDLQLAGNVLRLAVGNQSVEFEGNKELKKIVAPAKEKYNEWKDIAAPEGAYIVVRDPYGHNSAKEAYAPQRVIPIDQPGVPDETTPSTPDVEPQSADIQLKKYIGGKSEVASVEAAEGLKDSQTEAEAYKASA